MNEMSRNIWSGDTISYIYGHYHKSSNIIRGIWNMNIAPDSIRNCYIVIDNILPYDDCSHQVESISVEISNCSKRGSLTTPGNVVHQRQQGDTYSKPYYLPTSVSLPCFWCETSPGSWTPWAKSHSTSCWPEGR